MDPCPAHAQKTRDPSDPTPISLLRPGSAPLAAAAIANVGENFNQLDPAGLPNPQIFFFTYDTLNKEHGWIPRQVLPPGQFYRNRNAGLGIQASSNSWKLRLRGKRRSESGACAHRVHSAFALFRLFIHTWLRSKYFRSICRSESKARKESSRANALRSCALFSLRSL